MAGGAVRLGVGWDGAQPSCFRLTLPFRGFQVEPDSL